MCARIYKELLQSVDASGGLAVHETSGGQLYHGGAAEMQRVLEVVLPPDAKTKLLLVDDVHRLVADGDDRTARRVLGLLADEMRRRGSDKLVVVLVARGADAGLLGLDADLPDQFPLRFEFGHLDDAAIRALAVKHLRLNPSDEELSRALATGGRRMYVERGEDLDVFVRKLVRARDSNSAFSNAYAISSAVAMVLDRQAARIARNAAAAEISAAGGVEQVKAKAAVAAGGDDRAARRELYLRKLEREERHGVAPEDLLVKTDLLGSERQLALEDMPAWGALNRMVGLEGIKAAVRAQAQLIVDNRARLDAGQPLVPPMLNRLVRAPRR